MRNISVLIGSLILLLPAAAALELSAEAVEPVAYVVGFGTLPADRTTYLGERVVDVNEAIRFFVVETANPVAFEARVALDDNVEYYELNVEGVHASFVPNDTHYNQYQYSMKPAATNMENAWDRTFGATSVKLCILDTGQNRAHEDLKTLTYFWWYDAIGNKGKPYDDNGHGSHVTGTAAAAINNGKGVAGIAAGASIGGAKVLNRQGSGTWSQVANGITNGADAGCHVESMSLGATSGTATLQNAINYALGQGVFIAAAAGNGGCSNCVEYPAKYAGVTGVSCTDEGNGLCSFSSTGPEVDFAAPGNNIASTWAAAAPCNKRNANTCYVISSGTSMSTPHVAGLAALVKTTSPSFSKDQIYDRMKTTARDLGAGGFDNNFGWGLIQGTAA